MKTEKGFTVKDLPESERPYEKCMQYGVKALSDAELLAVIIKSGTVKKTVTELAQEILKKRNGIEGLALLPRLSYEELTEIQGIGKVKAIQILCACELAGRMAKIKARKSLSFHSPDSIAQYFMEEMRYLDKEEIRVLYFDGKHALVKESTISKGTVNLAITTPRELLIEALRCKAVYFVLLHNHPSGDPTPSKADLMLTKRVEEAGKLVGIQLSDHIVLGDQQFVSFREKGLLE